MSSEDQYPSLPNACVICGGNESLEGQAITRVFTPGWVWLFLPLGILPAALIGLAVQTKHQFSLLVCQPCRARRFWASAVHWVAMLSSLVLIFVAISVGVMYQSWLAFLGVLIVACGVAFASGKFHDRTNPRYTVFTREKVELEIPGRGRFVVFPPWHLLNSAR
ncbi:MAG TPA: hypothetical protein VGQ36_03470 [Thermoanaerobaculia bacterium]|nr:hypothetical protein [Thermoanaerobaculia bacterium]